jgi:predicted nucleotidyltransferase component of viral defense system
MNEFAQKEHLMVEREMVEEVSLIGTFNGVKVDMIQYPYPLIDKLIQEEGMRILSPKDIAPMKLSAIAKRGAKKDFFDFYELLNVFSLQEMLDFYQEKFTPTDTTFLLRALVYFEDAEQQDNPIMLKSYTWEQVKKEITKQVQHYLSS